jgi:hypothetical protein
MTKVDLLKDSLSPEQRTRQRTEDNRRTINDK